MSLPTEGPVLRACKHYVNLNYICNERCVFCASDLTNNPAIPVTRKQLTRAQVREWSEQAPPEAGDRVLLAGGEPTLNRDLPGIAADFRERCSDITLFTNGLRLADAGYARELVEAGIRRFEIAFFGATAATHDRVTQVAGSYDRTMAALRALVQLRQTAEFVVQVRLLIARHCYLELPEIVRAVHAQAPGIDEFSLNRLILSDHASSEDATISWAAARDSINAAATLVRELGYGFVGTALPLCVYQGEIARFIGKELEEQRARRAAGIEPRQWDFRYLDPVWWHGETAGKSSRVSMPVIDVCAGCDYFTECGRVEDWYLERFGPSGLETVRLVPSHA